MFGVSSGDAKRELAPGVGVLPSKLPNGASEGVPTFEDCGVELSGQIMRLLGVLVFVIEGDWPRLKKYQKICLLYTSPSPRD